MSLAESIKSQKSNQHAFKADTQHLRVSALAGTGKTTTLCDLALNSMMGNPMPFDPSPAQSDIIKEVNRYGKVKSVIFVAFSKAIQKELQSRLPAGIEAKTLHAFGFRVINQNIRLKRGKGTVNAWKVFNLLSETLDQDPREWRLKNRPTLNALEDLVKYLKVNLVPQEDWANEQVLDAICSQYNIELNGDKEYVYEMAGWILARTLSGFETDKYIDFNDMIWIPVMKDYPVPKYDLMLIDESQDLNKLQQELASRAGRRLVMVGDENQAIFGFAGADKNSMDNFVEKLGGNCVDLPLTETRRCGKDIVRLAQQLVPTFEAHESNPQGDVSTATYSPEKKDNYREAVEDGDMVLARTNAILVSECFRFLKAGRKALIKGKDVGTNLVKLIEKMGIKHDVGELMDKLDSWRDKESEKEGKRKNPNEARLIGIADKHECLITFCQECATVQEVKDKITALFSDEGTEGIQLSSMHKSKGLESNTVHIIEHSNSTVPHIMAVKNGAEEVEAEYRLLYVAITRAINKLVLVSDGNTAVRDLAAQAGLL